MLGAGAPGVHPVQQPPGLKAESGNVDGGPGDTEAVPQLSEGRGWSPPHPTSGQTQSGVLMNKVATGLGQGTQAFSDRPFQGRPPDSHPQAIAPGREPGAPNKARRLCVQVSCRGNARSERGRGRGRDPLQLLHRWPGNPFCAPTCPKQSDTYLALKVYVQTLTQFTSHLSRDI